MNGLPSSRADAKRLGEKRYFTRKTCSKGHIVERYTSDGTCVECARLKLKSRYEDAPEKERERSRKYLEKNRDLVHQRANAKRAADPETARAREREWNNKNPDAAKLKWRKRYDGDPAKQIARSLDYYEKNKDRLKEKRSAREKLEREYNHFIAALEKEEAP